MSIADEIERLHQLNRSGALSDEEFARAKERLLASMDSKDSGSSSNAIGTNPLHRLRRSKDDQWLGGVCAGLAKFTETETWVWRMLWLLSVVCAGFGVLAYLLAWVFIPLED